jgi:hypothetical protein
MLKIYSTYTCLANGGKNTLIYKQFAKLLIFNIYISHFRSYVALLFTSLLFESEFILEYKTDNTGNDTIATISKDFKEGQRTPRRPRALKRHF